MCARACAARQESKQADAETLNELTGNLEYYRQRESSDAGASAAVVAAASTAVVAAASTAAAVVPALFAAPIVDQDKPGPGEAESAEEQLSLPPIVRMVEIVETGSGVDEYTGQEYTTYVMTCTAGAEDADKTPSAAGVREDARPDDGATGGAFAVPAPPVSSATAVMEWTVSKRFSDFSNLRAELAALPTIGAVVETMDFPPSTWNFLPWGAGKLDGVCLPFPYFSRTHTKIRVSSHARQAAGQCITVRLSDAGLLHVCWDV
eukprot:COSAG02_NODE_560_length_20328_cov_15.507343_5_plen_263_part_00